MIQKTLITTALLIFGLVLIASPAQAADIWGACGGNTTGVCSGSTDTAGGAVKRVIDLFLFGIGVIAIIMIIHSGLKYIMSRGNPEAIKAAKDTLLYSVVGLVVALASYAIVGFILSRF